MVYLLLAIASSSVLSIVMRLSNGKTRSQFTMIATNYLVCAILGALYTDVSALGQHTGGLGLTAGLGVINGAILPLGLILLHYSTKKNGIVLSSLFMKLGLLVPFVMSIVFFGEMPTWLQVAGFVTAIGAIVLFNVKKEGEKDRFGIALILLLLANGAADALVKIFEEVGPEPLSDLFLCFSFVVAFVLSVGLILYHKERPDGKALLFGALIGVANFFSFKFLLAALTQVPAVVAFPTFSVAAMLTVTLSGVLFFKERLSKRQWLAFAGVIVALALLNI